MSDSVVFPRRWKARFAGVTATLIVAATVCWPVIRFVQHARQHDRDVAERAAEFQRHTPEQWAVLARACRTFWELAREAKMAGNPEPPLPADLARLKPLNVFVRGNGLSFGWTGGFDGVVLYLEYEIDALGKATLWLLSDRNENFERAVWSELNPLPQSRVGR